MLKFKVGDNVKVTAGKDKGRDGAIEKILVSEAKAIIPGVNIYKRHVKGQQGQKGGIYDIPRPLNFAKIALICPKCKKVTRVGFRIVDGTKERICRKCERTIDTKGKK
jgi:large subunit ribosomal protein L24